MIQGLYNSNETELYDKVLHRYQKFTSERHPRVLNHFCIFISSFLFLKFLFFFYYWNIIGWRRLFRVPWSRRRSNQSILKRSTLNTYWNDWCWSWSSNTLTAWCEELTPWKRPWCWERLRAGGEGEDRGWDDWMAWLTQWTWVWASSRRQRRTERPVMLQSIGSQRVRHDWVTDWTKRRFRTLC